MVEKTSYIVSEKGRRFAITSHLGCKDYGIYVATCRICKQQYVGQTSESFSKRWNSHRSNWKNGNVEGGDKAALRLHYVNHHSTQQNATLPSIFKVTFVDKPDSFKDLDLMESRWIKRLQAKININETILPQIT